MHLNLLNFQDEGSEECLPCLPGHYCSDETTSEEAMLRVMVCPPGFLCSKGLDRDPQRSAVLCPIGFYCPGGGVVSESLSAVPGCKKSHFVIIIAKMVRTSITLKLLRSLYVCAQIFIH